MGVLFSLLPLLFYIFGLTKTKTHCICTDTAITRACKLFYWKLVTAATPRIMVV